DACASEQASAPAPCATATTAPRVSTRSCPATAGSPPSGRPFVLAGVGDGASGQASSQAVADLITGWSPNMFLYLGDVYEHGSRAEFHNWYGTGASFFSRFRSITNPTVGNHEYVTSGAAGYFDYWDNAPHYFSVDTAGWHIVSI